jgi:hypothetical protein
MPGLGITTNKNLSMKLWIFGHSVCLPYGLESESLGWAEILGKELGAEVKNFAQPGADNFYIYASYQQNQNLIQVQDKVIVGWSHPSRKSFVLDRTNSNHVSVLDQSLIYQLDQCELIRSNNINSRAFSTWNKFYPINTGKQFYDTWFADYYSRYEQMINLKSYCDSIKLNCMGQYIPFFFSKESVEGMDVTGVGYILDFIRDHQLSLSNTDMHPNAQGHRLWANHLKSYLTEL